MTLSNRNESMIPNEYGPLGSFIKASIASTRFTLVLIGQGEFPEDDPVYGHHWMVCALPVGQFATITDATDTLESMTLSELESLAKQTCQDLSHFDGNRVEVLDYNHQLVYGAPLDSEGIVNWQPILSRPEERMALQKKIGDLFQQARLESGWDNLSTANSLRKTAVHLQYQLSDHIVVRSPKFQEEMRVLSDRLKHRAEARQSFLERNPAFTFSS